MLIRDLARLRRRRVSNQACVRVYRGTWQQMSNDLLPEAVKHEPGAPPAVWVTTKRDEARNYAFQSVGRAAYTHVLHLSVAEGEILDLIPRADRGDSWWVEDITALNAFRAERGIEKSNLATNDVQWLDLRDAAVAAGVVAMRYSPHNLAVVDLSRLAVLGRQRAGVE